jgi:serine/threonine protein kinase
VINEGLTHLSTTAMGTVSHQAPELMRSGRLSKQADVFSFGVISEWLSCKKLLREFNSS